MAPKLFRLKGWRKNKRKGIKRIVYRQKIVNNIYLGNNHFVSIHNATFNLHNYYRCDNHSTFDKNVEELAQVDYVNLEASPNTCGVKEQDEDNFKTNLKQSKMLDGTKTLTYSDNHALNNKMISKVIATKSSNKMLQSFHTNESDHVDGKTTMHKTFQDQLTILAESFRKINLKDKSPFIANSSHIKPCHISKIVGTNITKKLIRNKRKLLINSTFHTTPRFIVTSPKKCIKITPLSGTSTPRNIGTKDKRSSMSKNYWELSPIMEAFVEQPDNSIVVPNKAVKVINYDEDLDQVNNSIDDIFDLSCLESFGKEDENIDGIQKREEKHDETGDLDTTVYVDTNCDEPKTLTANKVRRLTQRYSATINLTNSLVNDSYVSTNSFLISSTEVGPSKADNEFIISGSDESDDETNEINQTEISQSYYKNKKSLALSGLTENNTQFSSDDEETLNSKQDASNMFSTLNTDDFKKDESECYLHVTPGKKWRRSLLAAGIKKRSTLALSNTMDTAKHNWTIRYSIKPQLFKGSENSVIASPNTNQFSGYFAIRESKIDPKLLAYDSFLNDTSLNTPTKVLNWEIHREVANILQTEDPEKTFLSVMQDRRYAEEKVLALCGQTAPLQFEQYLEKSKISKKIGEGMYGEVYLINRENEAIVLKVLPIEGKTLFNLAVQKTFSEVFSEMCIALSLSGLKNTTKNNFTDSYCSILRIKCLIGRYPKGLMEAWRKYDNTYGSENDSPEMYQASQLHVALEMLPGGDPLESYVFCSARQSYSILVQVIHALAAAETAFQFEHRDLHWGNILVAKTSARCVQYVINGHKYSVQTYGRKATIIDYTLSRIQSGNVDIYNDLERDKDIFQACGDYQFDIYRDMRRDVGSHWDLFVPKTNVRWLHYLTSKCYKGVNYKCKHKTHRIYRMKIKALRDSIINYASATEILKDLH